MSKEIVFYHNPNSPSRLTSINLLKTIAILMVLFVHTGQLFKCWPLYDACKLGQLGCQCFFLISGFTLSLSWERGNNDLLTFYKRRWWAIAPGYYSAIFIYFLCCLIITLTPLPLYWQQDCSMMGWMLNATFTHGLSPEHINKVVPGGWYIGTTAVLYILFPFLKKLIDYLCNYKKQYLMLSSVLLSLLPLGVWIYCHHHWSNVELGNNTFMFFSAINQLPSFFIGILLCKSYKMGGVMNKSTLYTAMVISSSVTVALFYSTFYWAFSVVPVTATLFFASLLILITSQNPELGKSTVVAKISEVSYEMYLVHSLFTFFITYWIIKSIKHFHYDMLLSSILFPLLCYITVVALSFIMAKAMHIILRKIVCCFHN